tara:strand:+ start:384 stop:680 length:297 start_codon:yes stop_codon:yes gene_type:complete
MEGGSLQILIDIIFGVVVFLGGWLLKVTFSQINTLRADYDDLYEQAREDYRKLSENMHDLALSMPEKYVAKKDLDKLIDHFNDRFDKIDAKLDNISNK